MAANWKIIGQIGNVIKKENCYLVNIAENRYKLKDNNWIKEHTIWFSCISDFEPKIDIGDKVIAEGEYLPSKSKNYPYVMKISHIGVINKR